MCGEIQISEEFEYKHYRGQLMSFQGFKTNLIADIELRKCTRKKYSCKINLTAHFLSSMSTSKVALNLRTSLIAPSNKRFVLCIGCDAI